MTDYIILHHIHESDTWEVYAIREASSPTRAIKAAPVSEGKFVAVPSRSWNPVEVKLEQTVKVTIG